MNILNYTAAIIAIHDGGLPVFETETDYQIHVDEVPTCTTVTSLYSKNSVFIPPQKYSNTVIKKNAHCSRAQGKKEPTSYLGQADSLPGKQLFLLTCSLDKVPGKPYFNPISLVYRLFL